MSNLSYDELKIAPLHEVMSGMHSTKKSLSYEDLLRQAGWTAESYLYDALHAVAKAKAEGYEIADTGAVIAAFMAAAASDFAIGASMKFAEENPGLFIRL